MLRVRCFRFPGLRPRSIIVQRENSAILRNPSSVLVLTPPPQGDHQTNQTKIFSTNYAGEKVQYMQKSSKVFSLLFQFFLEHFTVSLLITLKVTFFSHIRLSQRKIAKLTHICEKR